MRVIALDKQLQGTRLHKVGIDGTWAYVTPSKSKFVEMWRVNTLSPASWQRVDVNDLFYALPALDKFSPNVYVCVVAVFPDGVGRVAIFEVDRNVYDAAPREFRPDDGAVSRLDPVPFDAMALGCSDDGSLFLYDRSVVMGFLPFYRIRLNRSEGTFSLEAEHLPDEGEERCSRFPLLLDGTTRKYAENSIFKKSGRCARFRDDKTVAVYDSSTNSWIPYTLSPESQVNEWTVLSRGVVRLPRSVSQMCYLMVHEERVVVLGLRAVAVIPLGPSSLRAACVWRLQQLHAEHDESQECWKGGLIEQELRDLCGYRGPRDLLSD